MEEATAKGVTLPKSLAVAVVWGPVRRRRLAIAARLAAAVAATPPGARGVWLRAVLAPGDAAGPVAGPGDSAVGAAWDGAVGAVTPEKAAGLIIGLLFAAHKVPVRFRPYATRRLLNPISRSNRRGGKQNPAIGAAQTVLFLLEDAAAGGAWARRCVRERAALTASVQEALRLTAHSLGAIRKVDPPTRRKSPHLPATAH